MAKKKKGTSVQQSLSPEKYIQTKARNLPVAECLIGENWQQSGLATILVARRHVSGNYTLGVYLTDIFCLGVKDSFYRFNISVEDYEEYKEHLNKIGKMLSITYNEAHNLIFGSIAFAEEIGIDSCKSFKLTQYLLEEDTDDIPLIEYEFGKDGKPCLMVSSALEGSRYLPLLEEFTGGDFLYFIQGEEYVNEDESSDDERFPTVAYTYVHPEYPQELHLTHEELMLLFDKKHNDFLDRKDIENLLSLPRETLVADLEQIILFEIGRTNRELEEDMLSEDYECAMMHSLILLAELKSEESVDIVLEVMRQNRELMGVMFGDTAPQILPHVLYHVGNNKLREIQDYLMEPGLDAFFKYYAFSAVKAIVEVQPERREEVIAWWRHMLNWFIEQEDNTTVFDGGLLGMMMVDLDDIKAIELLPEIKGLFDTGKVDIYCAGDYERVKEDMEQAKFPDEKFQLMDINEWYAMYRKMWGNK